jgi:hypothetical protein
MKKLFVLIAALALITYGCKKDQPQPTNQLVDVSFSTTLMSKAIGGTKADTCSLDLADYAKIIVDGTVYTVDIYYIDGVPYTQSIKLSAPETGEATHSITQFLLYSDNNTPDLGDDNVLAATPADGSDYVGYVTDGVPMTFTLGGFVKKEIPIEVLCFADHEYTEFGFFWYTFDEIIIRTQCFFGDLCVKHLADYEGSLYEDQDGGLKMDMPAIFYINVKRNHENYKQVSNVGWLGVGEPLCVEYEDLIGSEDFYEFELSVLVKVGNNFQPVVFHTWTFTDDQMITAGADGVVDFVIGNCVLSPSDFTFPPYMDLPTTVSMNIHNPGDPGYWDVAIISVSPDPSPGYYDLMPGNYSGWCGDKDHVIGNGGHTANVYSSLNPANWPAGMPTGYPEKIAKVNWIFNHLSYYGMDILSLDQAQGLVLQNAVWAIINGWAVSGDAADMRDDANDWASVNGNFVPLPGGYAAVLFVTNDDPGIQLIFTLVDP